MNKLLPEFFRRLDEGPDEQFYQLPRLVDHIDQAADKAARNLYDELLPEGGTILDLMASYNSHLPGKFGKVYGLGLNLVELQENPVIDEPIVHDINRSERLPFTEGQFDGVVCTVSIQYMTRPDETFAEIVRILKPDAPFIVTFSNRMFPSKAVLAWRASDDAAHIRLVKSYFEQVLAFTEPSLRSFVPSEGDPLYAVWSYKRADAASLN